MMNNYQGRRASDKRGFLNPAKVPAIDIPLRVKRELAPAMLALSVFKEIPTEDLIADAFRLKNVHTSDRASAIAVLKGIK